MSEYRLPHGGQKRTPGSLGTGVTLKCWESNSGHPEEQPLMLYTAWPPPQPWKALGTASHYKICAGTIAQW